jgi:hypothetical protein
MKRFVVALACAFVAACGSTPAAPTPPASVAGGWSGTVQYTAGGTPGTQAVLMDLTQAGDTVNGTYSAQNFNGTVTGSTTPTSFSGTFTFNARTVTGASCSGTFAASGTAGGATLTWTSPGVTATCTGTPVNLTIAVQHR